MTKDWISNLLFVPKEHIYNSCKEEIYISRYIHILYIHTQKLKEKSEKAGLKLNIQKMKIMASGPITSGQIDEEKGKQWQILFWGAPKSLQMVIAAMK